MAAVAPQRYKSGEERLQKKTENKTEVTRPPQKETAHICLAFSSLRCPSARAARLAPPIANRLDTAVSIVKADETMVTAAVCCGSFNNPTKYVCQAVNQHNHLADNGWKDLLEHSFFYRHLLKQKCFIYGFCHMQITFINIKILKFSARICKINFSIPAFYYNSRFSFCQE